MAMRGCPNCGCFDHVKLDADAFDASVYLKIYSGFTHISVRPLICLNCGNIYLNSTDLNLIKEKLNAKS